MRFSICIPTVRAATLAFAVDSVRRQSFSDWELLVIGQGERGPLQEATERAAQGDPRIKYLHLDRRGVSSARNAGIAATSGDLIAFLDDDCEAREDWLAELDACFSPGIDFVGGEVTAPRLDGKPLFDVCPEVHPDEVTVYPDGSELPPGFAILGANMAVRRSAALRVGPFDECLGPGSTFAGAEEHDYCFRLRSLGARLRSTSRASVQHTYGRRFGVVDFYHYKRDRLGADGAFAAKRRMMQVPPTSSVNTNLWHEFRSQVTTVDMIRLPLSVFRLYHYLRAYRQWYARLRDAFEAADRVYVVADGALMVPITVADHAKVDELAATIAKLEQKGRAAA
jgi:glycosyltransferase involved in cell wall biosynthesis